MEVRIGKQVSNTKNPLLRKDLLGQVPPPFVNLPPEDFVYGQPSAPREEGTGDLMQWKSYSKKNPPPAERDFLRLNSKAVASHITTARDLRLFSQEQDIKKTRGPSPLRRPVALPSDLDQNFVYGHKNHFSNDMTQLITNAYQAEWLRAQQNQHQREHQQTRHVPSVQARGLVSPPRARVHSASTLKDTFKMQRFLNIPAKVNMGRSPPRDPSPPRTREDYQKDVLARDMKIHAEGEGEADVASGPVQDALVLEHPSDPSSPPKVRESHSPHRCHHHHHCHHD